jgi:hypothetical protein
VADQLGENYVHLVDPTFCKPPSYTFVSATFVVRSSIPESPLSPLSFFAAAAKLSVGRTVGLRSRCGGGVGWLLMVGLGCADPGSTDPLLGTPRSEPVRELVRDMECCWLSFPFSFSIRSETSASLAETSTGLNQVSKFWGQTLSEGQTLQYRKGSDEWYWRG